MTFDDLVKARLASVLAANTPRLQAAPGAGPVMPWRNVGFVRYDDFREHLVEAQRAFEGVNADRDYRVWLHLFEWALHAG